MHNSRKMLSFWSWSIFSFMFSVNVTIAEKNKNNSRFFFFFYKRWNHAFGSTQELQDWIKNYLWLENETMNVFGLCHLSGVIIVNAFHGVKWRQRGSHCSQGKRRRKYILIPVVKMHWAKWGKCGDAVRTFRVVKCVFLKKLNTMAASEMKCWWLWFHVRSDLLLFM